MTKFETADETFEEFSKTSAHRFDQIDPDDKFDVEYVECRAPRIIDWDKYDLRRNTSVVDQ